MDISALKTFEKQLLYKIDKATEDINMYLLNYFRSCFTTKSFGNDSWPQTTSNADTLVDTGQLRNSIKTVIRSRNEIVIASDLPYANIHNYGGRIRITDKMRDFFWSKYYKTNNNDWKYMALTKKTHITIPKRQFIGFNQEIINHINDIFKKYISQ